MSTQILPDTTDPVAGPFWAAARKHRLSVQRCLACGEYRYPPLAACPYCLSEDTEWVDLDPVGTVWSFAVYHRVLQPSFEGQVPYTIAVVDIDGGPRITARMADSRPVAVGDRVTGVFERITDEVTLMRWQPA